jgi:hypothetical protein
VRRRGRLDATHAAIVAALEAIGATVQSLADIGGGCPDLLVGFLGRMFLLEVKNPERATKAGVPRDKKPAEQQRGWRDWWRGPAPVTVWNVDDALRAVGAIH